MFEDSDQIVWDCDQNIRDLEWKARDFDRNGWHFDQTVRDFDWNVGDFDGNIFEISTKFLRFRPEN